VSVADDAAGQRVRCPHCEQTFLAPGIASTTNDDDDWLSLDEAPAKPQQPATPPPAPTPSAASSPPAAQPPPAAGTPAPESKVTQSTTPPAGTPKTGKSPSPALSKDDEALLAQFTTDLDEFTAEIETPPPPFPGSPGGGGAFSKAKGDPPRRAATSPAADKASGAKPSTPKPTASPVQYATDYRVTCNICGSMLCVKAQDAGKTLKCSDCYSPITIPPPPRVRKKQEIDLEEAETFQLEQSQFAERGPDPFKKSAEQLLEEASREEETNLSPQYDDVPSVKDWVKNVFGIFTDLGVLVHWLGLSVLAAVPAMLALQMAPPILILGLFPAGFFLGVLTVSCGFAIMNAVANQEDSVAEWPTLDPFAWFGQLFVVVAAASLAAIPPWALCQFILGPNLLGVAVTMVSVYVLFPFILLSMLDMNSAFVPFSPEVARSVSKGEEAWGGFYFSSGLLFVGLFLIFATASSMSPAAGAAVAIFAGIGVTFSYFALLGRLAYAIGQAVNAPPMNNEIDRTRQTDT
jgi:hypothetical protein